VPIATADDKFYYTDKGGKIAKGGLSESKRSKYDSEIANALAPQATPAPLAVAPLPPAPSLPGPQSLAEANINISKDAWPDPSGNIQSLAELPQSQQLQQQQQVQDPMQPMQPMQPTMYAPSVAPQDIAMGFDQAFATRQKAAQDLAKVEANKAEDLLKMQAQQQQRIGQYEYDIANEQTRKMQAIEGVEGKLAEINNKVAKATVDPNRLFGGSTGRQIMAGIAIAFGSIGQALTKANSNTALDIINKAIDRDIAAQEGDIENLRGQSVMQRQILSDTYRKFDDKVAAQIAQKDAYLAGVQQQVQMMGLRYGTAEAQAKAADTIGQLDQLRASNKMQLYNIEEAKAAQRNNMLKQSIDKQDEKSKELKKLMVPGFGVALTDQDAKDLKTGIEAKKQFDDRMKQLIDLREKAGGGQVLDRSAVANAKRIASELRVAYKNLASLGVLSNTDYKLIDPVVPEDPTQFRDPISAMRGTDPALDTMKSFLADTNKDFASKIQTRMQYIDPNVERMFAGAEENERLRRQYGITKPGEAPKTRAAQK
jgi:hypothetical protein